MTTVTIIGEDNATKEKKPIEFVKLITGRKDDGVLDASLSPNKFDYIELICLSGSHNYYDIMFAHNGKREDGMICLGHFNDGVVK